MLPRGDYEEKRDFARMGMECPASFQIEGDETIKKGMATDLSATGLCLSSDEALGMGVIVKVVVKPDRSIVSPLKARAEVVRCDKASYGYSIGLKVLEIMPSE